MKVEIVNFDDLTEEEQGFQPSNGGGKEYASYVKLSDETGTIMILSDAVEPEDATFRRDFSDVPLAIEKAYEIGLRDGANSTKEDE